MSTRAQRQQDKQQNELHAKMLKLLLQRADNRICADCRKKEPRWASWNLGIFMCIRCSGIHRSLGTHISKVKSIDLDTWTPEQIQNMQRWGNAKANHYWEHELPPNLEVPENNIEQWIRGKYERKQYAMKGPLPEPESIPLPPGVEDVQMPDGTSMLGRPTAAVMASPPKPKEVNLLGNISPPKPTTAPKQVPLVDDLFDSFQTAPMAATVSSPPKSTNDAILSLFSTPSVTSTAAPIGMGILNGTSMNQSQPMNGNSLLGDFDAFSAFQSTPSQPIQPMNLPIQPRAISNPMNLTSPQPIHPMNLTSSQPIQPMNLTSPQPIQPMNLPIQPITITPQTNFPSPPVQSTKQKQDDLFADFVSFSNATMKPQTNDLWGEFK